MREDLSEGRSPRAGQDGTVVLAGSSWLLSGGRAVGAEGERRTRGRGLQEPCLQSGLSLAWPGPPSSVSLCPHSCPEAGWKAACWQGDVGRLPQAAWRAWKGRAWEASAGGLAGLVLSPTGVLVAATACVFGALLPEQLFLALMCQVPTHRLLMTARGT